MTEPRRPEPAVSWRNRLHDRIEQTRERLRARRRVGVSDASAAAIYDDESVIGPSPSLTFTALLAVGSAILALSGLWAWQSWSNRATEPIDALLPMFTDSDSESDSEPDSSAAPADPSDDTTSSPATLDDAQVSVSQPGGPEPTPTASAGVAPGVEIIVHVSGAVTDPGVVELLSGARVFEAVTQAGGATSLADLDRVNLAARVNDGERIHVPAVGEDPLPAILASPRPLAAGEGTNGEDPILDINVVSADDLESLPGIGPAIAEAIVRTREDRGPFLSIDELLDVPGIGDAKLALLAPHVVAGTGS